MNEFEVSKVEEPEKKPEKSSSDSGWMAEEQNTVVEPVPVKVKPAASVEQKPASRRKPDGVILVAIYHFLWAIPAAVASLMFILIILAVSLEPDADMGGRTVAIVVLSIFLLFSLLAGALSIVTGIGLLKMQNWARWLAIAQAMLSLLNFPLGTMISGAIILYLFTETTQAAFISE